MSSRTETPRSTSAYRLAGIVILLAAAGVAFVWALLVGGGANPPLLQDPGPVVLWGTPLAKLVMNIAGALMLGQHLGVISLCGIALVVTAGVGAALRRAPVPRETPERRDADLVLPVPQ